MPEFEVINSCCNKTGTKFLDLFRLTDSFRNFKLRLVQFSLIVIRSAKRYDLVKKKSDPAYDSVAYKVSSENYKVVTLVRRSDRSVFHNMPQWLGPSTVIDLFLSLLLYCKQRSRKRSRKTKTFRFLGHPIPAFKLMKPFTTPSTTDRSLWLVKISQTWTNFVQLRSSLARTPQSVFCFVIFCFSSSGSHALTALKDGKSAWKIQE